MKVTLFIPVKNEIEGLKLILPQIKREWVHEILVVDAQSNDGSLEYLAEQGIRVIDQKSKGLCGAYWECLAVATGDFLIAFSPDNNSIPEAIPQLIKKAAEGNDLVIASRYLPPAKSEDDDIVTAFGNWMFTGIVNLLFGCKYTDVLVMYRAFRKDLVAELGMSQGHHPVFEVQMAIRCAKRKLRVAEIPASEPKRVGGVRKMKPLYNGFWNLWAIVCETVR